MDYTQEYKQKLVSADEAVKVIKSGDWVDVLELRMHWIKPLQNVRMN